MTSIQVLGYVAGTISTLVFLPQVIKTWKTKSANDISIYMFLFATLSVILWLGYGVLVKDGAIIYTNSVILVLSSIMLYFKLRFK
jgi:MtN3 and saliva related transmembrane protein